MSLSVSYLLIFNAKWVLNIIDTETQGLDAGLSLKTRPGDKWEGEDEDDDVKDNWDDEDPDPESEASSTADQQPKPVAISKKKSLAKKIAEKEEKMRQKLLERQTPLSPEEILAEKLEKQRLQEESDLRLAKEAMGITDGSSASSPLDNLSLNTKEDFDEFKKGLVTRLRSVERSIHYVNFLESTIRDLTASLDPDDIKRISSTVTSLYNEKLKAQKVSWCHILMLF